MNKELFGKLVEVKELCRPMEEHLAQSRKIEAEVDAFEQRKLNDINTVFKVCLAGIGFLLLVPLRFITFLIPIPFIGPILAIVISCVVKKVMISSLGKKCEEMKKSAGDEWKMAMDIHDELLGQIDWLPQHCLFAEYLDSMIKMVSTGRADTLQEAIELAEDQVSRRNEESALRVEYEDSRERLNKSMSDVRGHRIAKVAKSFWLDFIYPTKY